MWKVFILLCLFPLLAGCATATAVRYPNIYYPSTNPNTVGIYYNFPPGNYEVIGEVAGSGAPAASWEVVGQYMRQKAAEIGGDAVVIQGQGNVYAGTYSSPGQVSGGSTGYRVGNFYFQDTSYRVSPGYSVPMYAKQARGIVIKLKSANLIKNKEIDYDKLIKVICPKGHKIHAYKGQTSIYCPNCAQEYSSNLYEI